MAIAAEEALPGWMAPYAERLYARYPEVLLALGHPSLPWEFEMDTSGAGGGRVELSDVAGRRVLRVSLARRCAASAARLAAGGIVPTPAAAPAVPGTACWHPQPTPPAAFAAAHAAHAAAVPAAAAFAAPAPLAGPPGGLGPAGWRQPQGPEPSVVPPRDCGTDDVAFGVWPTGARRDVPTVAAAAEHPAVVAASPPAFAPPPREVAAASPAVHTAAAQAPREGLTRPPKRPPACDPPPPAEPDSPRSPDYYKPWADAPAQKGKPRAAERAAKVPGGGQPPEGRRHLSPEGSTTSSRPRSPCRPASPSGSAGSAPTIAKTRTVSIELLHQVDEAASTASPVVRPGSPPSDLDYALPEGSDPEELQNPSLRVVEPADPPAQAQVQRLLPIRTRPLLTRSSTSLEEQPEANALNITTTRSGSTLSQRRGLALKLAGAQEPEAAPSGGHSPTRDEERRTRLRLLSGGLHCRSPENKQPAVQLMFFTTAEPEVEARASEEEAEADSPRSASDSVADSTAEGAPKSPCPPKSPVQRSQGRRPSLSLADARAQSMSMPVLPRLQQRRPSITEGAPIKVTPVMMAKPMSVPRWLPGAFPGRRTVFFFDWDDTLCPTSWIRSVLKETLADMEEWAMGNGHDNEMDWRDSVPSWFNQPLPDEPVVREPVAELQEAVIHLINAVQAFGVVCIVTNAVPGWVEKTIKRWLPKLKQYISGHGSRPPIRVLYAQQTYRRPKDGTLPWVDELGEHMWWKHSAMTQALEDLDALYRMKGSESRSQTMPDVAWCDGGADKRLSHVISVGDNEAEMQAAVLTTYGYELRRASCIAARTSAVSPRGKGSRSPLQFVSQGSDDSMTPRPETPRVGAPAAPAARRAGQRRNSETIREASHFPWVKLVKFRECSHVRQLRMQLEELAHILPQIAALREHHRIELGSETENRTFSTMSSDWEADERHFVGVESDKVEMSLRVQTV